MILKGVLKSYDDTTHRATVQILGSITTWLADIPVSHALMATDMVAGRYVAVLTPDPAKPGDSVVVALWTATTPPAGPSSGGGFHALDPTQTYRIWRMINVGSTPRTATVSSISGDVITLTANVAFKFYDTLMNGCSYVKIANTTRGEYAWIKDVPAANQLQVTDAADIASWVSGNVVSTAYDGGTSNRCEIDVSPCIGATDKGVLFATVELRDSGGAGYFTAAYASGTSLNYTAQFTQVASKTIDNAGVVSLSPGNRLFIRDYASGAATLTSFILATAYTD